MVGVMFVILGITMITVLVKIAFYAYSLYYLNRNQISSRGSPPERPVADNRPAPP